MQTLRLTSFSAWCWANQNSRIPIFTRPPRVQTCWLCPCLFVCMYSASSVIKICQSQVHQPTQRWTRHSVLQTCMLKQLSPANLWLPRTQKKKQEMIICISANLSSQTLTNKMNTVKPWHDRRFCAHMPKCVRNSSPHLSVNNTTGCHLAFTRSRWWEGDMVLLPSWFPQNRPRVSCPSCQHWVFFVMTHCQKAVQSSNLPRYAQSKF